MVPGRKYTPRYVLGLMRRHWVVVGVPVCVAGLVATVIAKSLPDVYYAQATVLIVPQRIPESYVKTTVTTPIQDRLRSARENVIAPDRLEAIIDEFDLYRNFRDRGVPMEMLVAWMRRNIKVELVRPDTFVVGFSGYRPHQVAKVADRLATLFIEQNLKDREVQADNTSQFLEAELRDAKDKLLEQERRVQAYREEHAGELPSQVDTNLRMMQTAYVQLQAVMEALRQDRDRRVLVERNLTAAIREAEAAPAAEAPAAGDGAPPVAEDDGTDPDPIKLPPGPPSRRLVAARALLGAMRMRLMPDHPDIVRLERVIKQLEQESAGQAATIDPKLGETMRDARIREAKAELARVDEQIAAREAVETKLRETIATYQSRVEGVPRREAEWTELTRDYGTTQQIYTNLLAKKQESQIAANLERRRISEQFKVASPPVVPTAPISPKRRVILLVGLAIGAALALVGLAAYELRDTSLRGESEIETALGLPVLAMVPVMVTSFDRWRRVRRRLAWSAATAAMLLAVMAWRWF